MYQIVSDYLDNEKYREEFNDLAKRTFGLDFESWYQNGYLRDGYKPYSIRQEGKIVANVSINKFHLVINNEVKKAIQIGTVMTDNACRGQGLSKYLMEHVLKEYNEKEYIVYLFANDTVLEFYPKLGFERVLEKQYEIDAKEVARQEATIRLLSYDHPQDYEKIELFAQNRKPVSKKLGIIKDRWPLLVYCDDDDTGELYYLEEDEIIVKAKRQDETLHLHDILCLKDFELDDVLEKLVEDTDERIELHFVPDTSKYKWIVTTIKKDDDALFIRSGQIFSNEILFPHTSHT